MVDFENQHLSMIEQYEASALDIERIFFTGRYKLSRKHFSLLSVQSIPILYSYWEGFVQNSFRLYIEYINSLNIEFDLLSDEIVVFHMDKTFKQLKKYPDKNKQKIYFYGKLKDHFLQSRHNIFQSVDTESNVGFLVLNKLLSQFSLDKFPEYWEHYTYPNPNLKETLDTFIRYRNGVVHGGDLSSEEKVTQEVYLKYRKLVSDLMYAIHNKFMDGIQKRTYLKEAKD